MCATLADLIARPFAMDPRLLTAVQTLVDSAPFFPRCELTPAYARMRAEFVVELIVPGHLDGDHADIYLVDLRTQESYGPMADGLTWPPPEDEGFIEVTKLLERVEDIATD
jgi:hypothetical protein